MKSSQRLHQQTEDYAHNESRNQTHGPLSNSDRLIQLEQHKAAEEEQETEQDGFQTEQPSHEQFETEPEEQPEAPGENEKTEASPDDAEVPTDESESEGGGGEGSASTEPGANVAGEPTVEDGAGSDDSASEPLDTPATKGPLIKDTPPITAPENNAPTLQSAPTSMVRPTVTPAAPAADPIIGSIWQFSMGSTPFQQQANAQYHIDGLHQFATLVQTELNFEAGNLATQVDAAIGARIGLINIQIDSAIAQTKAQFTTAREKSNADIAGVRTQITAATDSAKNQITSNEQQNIEKVASGFSDAQNNISPVAETMLTNVNAAWTERVQAIRDAGEEQAQVVLRGRDALQGNWQGGDGIENDKNKARREAASEVAAKYAAEIREKANMAADELNSGRGQIAPLIQDMLSPITGQMSAQQEQGEGSLSEMAEQARQGVETQRISAINACDTLSQQTRSSFGSQEESAVQQLENTRKSCTDSLISAGEALKTSIMNAANGFGQHYSDMMAQLEQVFSDGGDVPPDDEMNTASDQMYTDLEESQETQQQAMRNAFSGGIQQLDELVARAGESIRLALNQILTGVQTASAETTAQSQNISTEYSKSTQDTSDRMNKNMSDAAVQASDAANQTVLDTAAMATDPESELMKSLDSSRDNVIGQLTDSAKTANAEMRSSANAAASKVKKKPWYKKVWNVLANIASVITTIVVGIVVFVAIAAFCVGTFGTGAVALIAAGAIAGAVSAVASKFAGEAVHSLLTLSNKFADFKDYLRSFFVGGLAGGFAMGLGALFPTMNATLALTLDSFVGSAFQQLGDILFLGESWHWGEYFFTGAFAIGLSKFTNNIGKKKLNNWTISKLFPKNGVGNSWNRFQMWAAKTPGLKGLNNKARGLLWRKVVKSKAGGAPYKLVEKLAINPAKKELKEELVGENPGAKQPETQEDAQKEDNRSANNQ